MFGTTYLLGSASASVGTLARLARAAAGGVLRYCLYQFELHYNEHRPHQAMRQAVPLRAVPTPITDPDRIVYLDIRRTDLFGGIIHEYQHAA